MSTAPTLTDDAYRGRRGAHFDARLIGTSIAVHSISGELDARNSTEVSEFVEANLSTAERLVLDLRGLTFFGTHGFSAVHRVNVICSRQNVALAVVAGAEVDRILRICDPTGRLPITHSLEEAISAAVSPSPSRLKLVAGD